MTLSVSRHRRAHRAGWVVGTVLVVLGVLGAAAVGYVRVSGGCAGPPVTLEVAVSPDQFPVTRSLAEQWTATEPTAGERCAAVSVQSMPSSFAAANLSPSWDEQRDGTPPDVWVPDSSIWLSVAASRPDAASLLPEQTPPSLASSPVVLAMQRPMAEALGWPQEQIGWADLLGAFAGGQTWEQFGHPEWGPLRLGITDPTSSTAGAAAVTTVLDLDGDDTLSDEELLGGIGFSQMVTTQAEDTDALLRRFRSDGEVEPQELPAAFPVRERDLAGFLAEHPDAPLVPVYVREGVVFADYPYAVLRAPWVDQEHAQLAERFLSFLRGEQGRRGYEQAGFRGPNHAATGAALLSAERGFQADVAAPPRLPSAEGLGELLGMWPVLVRPNNVLIVLDTSGSMNDEVPGTDVSRLELLQDAATEGIGLLNNQTIVGLWEFSTELTPDTPYRQLVPVGPAGDQVGEESGGVDRRQAMVAAVQGLSASGGTGLYDTVHDAYLEMRRVWQPEAQNLLVVITDGRDEAHDGRSLPQLLTALEEEVRPDQPLPVIAMAVGPEADAAALEQITEVTGGRTIIARDDVSAIQQVVLAFAGRIS